MKRDALFVPKTVVLELEWAMHGVARLEAAAIHRCLLHLAALPNATLEDRPAVEKAIEWYGSGLDFADALHLASSATCDAMLSFDGRRFARRAARLGLAPRVESP